MARMDRLSTYCTTIATAGDLTCITYHKTQIVAFDRLYITLHTGGWDSVTTRRKMNQAANQFELGYRVYRDNGATFVALPDGRTVLMGDEITINRATA